MEINSWFECKVKMDVMKDDGTTKPETLTYLVDALNFTEAESRIIEEVKPYTSGNLDVTDIKRVKYAEIFASDNDMADKWYKVRCLFMTIDEKTQTEKEIANNMLVQAGTFHEADGRRGWRLYQQHLCPRMGGIPLAAKSAAWGRRLRPDHPNGGIRVGYLQLDRSQCGRLSAAK